MDVATARVGNLQGVGVLDQQYRIDSKVQKLETVDELDVDLDLENN